jgi:hypothetical protein
MLAWCWRIRLRGRFGDVVSFGLRLFRYLGQVISQSRLSSKGWNPMRNPMRRI